MFVLESTLLKERKELDKVLQELSDNYSKDRNNLITEIIELKRIINGQEWYRETWSDMILKQNEIMQEQSNALQQIADATWNRK